MIKIWQFLFTTEVKTATANEYSVIGEYFIEIRDLSFIFASHKCKDIILLK